MLKSFVKLEWSKLLDYFSENVVSDFVKQEVKQLLPNFDFEKAYILQAQTSYLWNLIEKGERIDLVPLKSLRFLFLKAQKRSVFLPLELIQIKQWFTVLKRLSSVLNNSPFSRLVEVYQGVMELEQQVLDRVLDYERKEIKDKASYQLYVIRKKIREALDLLYTKLDKLREHFFKKGYLQENLYTQKEGRYVLPVKVEFKNKVKGIFHGLSSSGATAFIEPVSIIGLSNELETLRHQEQREELKILKEVSQELFLKKDLFFELENLYLEFEVAWGKVNLGRVYRGIFPDLKPQGSLKIWQGVHPFLLLSQTEKKQVKAVRNDFFLEKGLLITGPNLGGKTVSLKTIGLICLMAQTGFLIPAERAEIPVFTQVFADIGDDQDIFQGESSFSSHLRGLKEILDQADSQTLVLLDEPGRGTDPEKGMALIAAVLEELLKRGVKVVVTTHSQFLKTLGFKIEGLKVATMEYDLETKEPTYSLVYDVYGDSLAFELAKKIGIPERILDRASEYLQNKEYWEWYKLWEKEFDKVKKLKESLENKEKELELRELQLNYKKEELEKHYVKQLELKFKEWEREFKKLIEELSEKGIGKKGGVKEFEKFVTKVLKESQKEETIQEGDYVLIKGFNQKGKVIKIKNNNLAEVVCGALKLELPLERLSKVILENHTLKSNQFQGFSLKASPTSQISKGIRKSVYLLGLTVDEALEEVEKELNRSFLEGVAEVYLVHGHGSGRLREAIHKHLKNHPLVREFRFAEQSKGGTGVTVVFLEKNY